MKIENLFSELKRPKIWGAHAPSRAGCGALAATCVPISNDAEEEETKSATTMASSPTRELRVLPGVNMRKPSEK